MNVMKNTEQIKEGDEKYILLPVLEDELFLYATILVLDIIDLKSYKYFPSNGLLLCKLGATEDPQIAKGH